MTPNDLIIVIGRQYGSGGRTIGKIIAQRLSLPYYDKELMHEAAASMGFSTEIFTHADEKRPSFFNRMVSQSYGLADGFATDTLSAEGIYQAQSKVIRAIADKGGCILVGRTSDYILRHHPHLLSVFLHSPIDRRIENVKCRGEHDDLRKCRETIARHDRNRQAYYNYFTGRKWGQADNYDLTVDSSKMSESAIADLICNVAELRFGK